MKVKKDILCPHFSLCSGCALNVDVDSPKVLEEAKSYFKSKGVGSFVLHTGAPVGWRCRAKLAVRGTVEAPLIGLYKEGTHNVVDIPFYKVHHQQINKAVERIREWIKNEQIPPYNEETKVGVLRYLQFVVERATGRVQLSLVMNEAEGGGAAKSKWEPKIKTLWDKGGKSFWHSVWVNYNTERNNVIFGNNWIMFHGEHLLWETFCDTKVCFQPSSFAQANLDAFEVMLNKIVSSVPENSRIVEFYAGVGVIGLVLAAKSRKVACCEINPFAEECFKISREQLNPPETAQKISFYVGKSADFGTKIEDSDVVIVDPPRKGLEKELLKKLVETKTPKVLYYISCGWPAFQRDCDELLAKGWFLEEAEGYLFFPGSEHIETLAVFRNRSLPQA